MLRGLKGKIVVRCELIGGDAFAWPSDQRHALLACFLLRSVVGALLRVYGSAEDADVRRVEQRLGVRLCHAASAFSMRAKAAKATMCASCASCDQSTYADPP